MKKLSKNRKPHSTLKPKQKKPPEAIRRSVPGDPQKLIRCPVCKEAKHFDAYLKTQNMGGAIACTSCGAIFLDRWNLKAIKKDIEERESGRPKIVAPTVKDVEVVARSKDRRPEK